jgi:hypothetical protein
MVYFTKYAALQGGNRSGGGREIHDTNLFSVRGVAA